MWDIAVWLNFACWDICFWWMHRLSLRQETMLSELQDQAHQIQKLSKAEHDLLREVYPTVEEIQSGMEEVASAMSEQARGNDR